MAHLAIMIVEGMVLPQQDELKCRIRVVSITKLAR